MLDNLFTPAHLIVFFVPLCLMLAVYCLPTIVAVYRHHHNRMPIILVNLLLGWSAIGWIVALIWSLTSPVPSQIVIVQQPQQTPPAL
ncbi:type II secretory pathway component PulF [Silvibacterium bohemicum]|uniref:Type II secretory pathway component PulF n=2 Tax=Silvibacterium bohemicum TaxID=1577686 RepID=A0A841JYA8_9BACT|nr:type II secretory pathway component PulF [Silvibacterium bohemicum]